MSPLPSLSAQNLSPRGNPVSHLLTLALFLSVNLLVNERVIAVPACPTPVTMRQPDGTGIKVRLRGDEEFHWHEDTNGFPILKEAKSARWVYAQPDATGQLTSSELMVGSADPKQNGLGRVTSKWTTAHRSARNLRSGSVVSARPDAIAPRTGLMKNLVVLVQFADLQGTHSRTEFEALFNSTSYHADGARGSVKDYYQEVSYGALTVESVVTEWVTLERGFAYYGANSGLGDSRPQQMVREALAKLEAGGFDFSTLDANNDGWVDGLTVIHAGGGEEYGGNNSDYIWSHKWNLGATAVYDRKQMFDYHTEPERRGFDSDPSSWGLTRIGVICHETGHFLGLPDLYDVDYSSDGVGRFCLMAGGSWNGDLGSQPAHMSAWCKARLGWVSPSVVTSPGTYAVPRVEDNRSIAKLVGKLPGREYFLIENRQGVGFDAALPGSARGILIWHIDDSQTDNRDETHFWVDLEEAGGQQDLEGESGGGDDEDYFRGGYRTVFSSSSTPNNRSYAGIGLGLNITDVSASGASMTFTVGGGSPLSKEMFVDWRSRAPRPDGTLARPFPTITQGAQALPSGGLLTVFGGNYALPTRVLSKPMRIESYNGRVLISADGVANGSTEIGAALSLNGTIRRTDGSFEWNFPTSVGTHYRVLSSTNLQDWMVWKEFVADADTSSFSDLQVDETPGRFFKVVLP